MRSFKKVMVLGLMALAVFFGIQGDSYGLSLRLDDISDGPGFLVINDGDPQDANPITGAVTFIGSVGNFTLNVSTGLSYPFQGGPGIPYLDLNTVSSTSNAAGELYIDLTQVGFNAQATGLNFQVGGTTQGQARFAVGVDNGDVPFGFSTFVGYVPVPNPTPATYFGPGSFSATANFGPIAFDNSYSLTIFADIVHNGPATTSFDAQLTVPEPSALLLLGIGLVGLCGFRKRNKK